MQLAWFKTADLYIGQGLVMLKISHEKTHIFELASTMPMDRLLSSCTGLLKKGTQLRITLSSALCTAIHVQVPADIIRVSELQAFLSATSAQQLNAPGVQFKCAFDPKNKSLVAAIPTNIHNSIHAWVSQQACSITTMRPMWSVLSQFAACQKTNIQGLLLHEPDGSMLIVQTENDSLQTISWRSQLAIDVMQANISRALVGFDLLEQNVQSLKFSAKPTVQMNPSPVTWSNHWSA